MLPDADGDADRASLKTRTDAFFDHIEKASKLFELTQDFVEEIADLYDVDAPTLKVAPVAGAPAVENPPVAPAALSVVR